MRAQCTLNSFIAQLMIRRRLQLKRMQIVWYYVWIRLRRATNDNVRPIYGIVLASSHKPAIPSRDSTHIQSEFSRSLSWAALKRPTSSQHTVQYYVYIVEALLCVLYSLSASAALFCCPRTRHNRLNGILRFFGVCVCEWVDSCRHSLLIRVCCTCYCTGCVRSVRSFLCFFLFAPNGTAGGVSIGECALQCVGAGVAVSFQPLHTLYYVVTVAF